MSNSVNLSLDVTKTGIQNPLIKVRQGDGGFETLHTTVTSNGEPLDLQGWTITFMGTTAGNHKIVDGNVKIIEAPNGIFDYTPSKAWGMDIGDFKMAYFKFVKGDGSASSANFRVSVIEAVDLTQDEAKNYISVVDATIADVRQRLTNSLADVTSSVAATSSAASSMAVYVSSMASSAVSQVDSAASSASSIASSAADKVSGVAAQVNALSVGGRNYVLNSSCLNASDSNKPTFIGSYSFVTSAVTYLSDGILITNASGNTTGEWFYQVANGWINFNDTPLNTSKPITFSVDVMGTAPQVMLRYGFNGEAGARENYKVFDINNTNWKRVSITITPNQSDTSFYFRIQAGNNNQVSNGWSGGETLKIRYVKIEEGNIATDWTPAPEDADNTFLKKSNQLPAEARDFNYLATHMQTYQGTWWNGPDAILNAPKDGLIWYNIEIAPGNAETAGAIIVTNLLTNDVYLANVVNGTIRGWKLIANDAEVVHTTRTETVAGDKTFTGNNTFSGTLKSSNQYLDVGSRIKSVDASGVTSMWFGWQVYWTVRNGYVTYQIRPTSTGTITPGSKSDEALPVEARPLLKVFVPLRWGGQGFSINTDGKLENDTGVNIDPNASWSTAVSATAQGW